MSFVVVVHLAPDAASQLAELLQPSSPVPVRQVLGTCSLEPDTVYIIPPGANLEAIDSHLRLAPLETRRRDRAQVDHFFETLARTHDGDSVAVVLTGAGSDGAAGLRRVKEEGGLTIVQDPLDAEYDGMPQSAIATGMVDMILPLASIPPALVSFFRAQPNLRVPEPDDSLEAATATLLERVLTQVRIRTGRDFSSYKPPTLIRRIIRRMQFRRLEDPEQYLEVVRSDADEARRLADDLLITVTSFFRDRPVFDCLASDVIPAILEQSGQNQIRAWSVGCATGEEAYSLAMAFQEAATRCETPPPIQIFASDLHPGALDRARDGFFAGDIESAVGSGRLRRFFRRENGGYQIRSELRDMVVFSPHNLLADPPFSRLHLISCRNLLIYFQRDLQRKVIELFHYALCPDGFLVLGGSEGIEAADYFSVVDKEARIYQKRNVPAPEPRLPVFPIGGFHRNQPAASRIAAATAPVEYTEIHRRLLTERASPSLLVSPEDNVVHFAAPSAPWLVHPLGAPTTNLYKLVREELRVEMHAVVSAAREQRRTVSSELLRTSLGPALEWVRLGAHASADPRYEGYVLVTFDEKPSAAPNAPEDADDADSDHAQPIEGSDDRVRELLAERQRSRRHLQTIIDEYETNREELKASNEELQSTNEELRSTLEELETSKEELQSMNEELRTLNQENRHKVDELAELGSDLHNLLVSTDIATLFLDRGLSILRFTPRAAELFNVRAVDRGRPLAHITHQLGYEELLEDAARVLQTLIPIEKEVRDSAGERVFLSRLSPYRGVDDRIEGVVLTLVDITERSRAQVAVEHYRGQYRSLFHSMSEGFCVLESVEDSSEVLHVVEANAAFAQQVGLPNLGGRVLHDIFGENADGWQSCCDEVLRTGHSQVRRHEIADNGRTLECVIFQADGTSGNNRLALLCKDVTERRRWEEALRSSEQRLADELGLMTRLHALVARLVPGADPQSTLHEVLCAVMAITDADMGHVEVWSANGRLEVTSQVGFEPELLAELNAANETEDSATRRAIRGRERVVLSDVLSEGTDPRLRVLAERAGYRGVQTTPLVTRGGKVLGVISTHYSSPFHPSDSDRRLLDLYIRPAVDWLERARSLASLRQSEARFRAMFEVTGVAAFQLDAHTGVLMEVNETFAHMLGSTPAALIGRASWEVTHPDDRQRARRGLRKMLDGSLATFQTEKRFVRTDGTSFWGFVAMSVISDDSQQRCLALMFDVTRRREVERSLEEQNQVKDDYLAMLGHELRNPLAAIESATELVRLAMGGEPRLGRAHEVLARQSAHITRLVDDLLEISRIGRGKVRVDLSPIDLMEVLEPILRDRADAVAAKGLDLRVELLDQEVWIRGDQTRLTQVFENLIGNALKFTDPPGELSLDTRIEDGYAVVRVRDTGVGVAPGRLEQIFESFHQEAQAIERPEGGLGLGLALAKGLVELHDGWIEARSEGPGRGTELIVRLPLTANPPDELAPPASSPELTTFRMLLVEDNRDTAEVLGEVLRLRGHAVSVARDARRALDILREQSADVVLCDLGLPGMSGYEFARAVRADPTLAHTLLLAFTGYGQAEDREKTAAAGFDGHLTKPVDTRRLETIITALLQRPTSPPPPRG